MEFAERHLRERGWSGKGLGRHEDGITEPITVKVKCDKAGIGHHLGEQFSFHWWDHVFNQAAANVLVGTAEQGVRPQEAGSHTEQQEDGPITNRKPRKAQQCRDLLYGRFIKSATLTPGTEGEVSAPSDSPDTSDSDEDEKLDLSSATRLTDEELVRVCGGRTGHRGARHGVTMNAKLLRLEAQERAFLAKCGQQPAAGGGDDIQTQTGTERRRRKKKKRWQSSPAESSDSCVKGKRFSFRPPAL
ncbi:G patch domain-containing protein 4 [Rhinoraja longicauda]